MISAKELRKIQIENKLYEDRNRFINATNKYYNMLINECKFAIEYMQNNNMTYIMLNTASLIRKTDNYSYTTMLFGFWDNQTASFNNSIFRDYDILSPLEKVGNDLEIFGYKLEHISDSMLLVLKLSF